MSIWSGSARRPRASTSAGQRCGRGELPYAQGDVGAGVGKRKRDGSSEPASGTRDEGHLAAQIEARIVVQSRSLQALAVDRVDGGAVFPGCFAWAGGLTISLDVCDLRGG